MALGTPDIPKLSGVSLPLVQQAVDRIRERFLRLEAEVSTATAVATTRQANTATDLARQIALIRSDLAALAVLVDLAGDDLTPAPRAARAIEIDLAPARHAPRPAEDDVAPAGAWRAALLAALERIEALELEPR